MFFFIKGNAIVLRFTYIVSQNGWLSLIVSCIIFIRLRLWARMCWFSHSPCRGAIHDGLWRSQQWFCLRGWIIDYKRSKSLLIDNFTSSTFDYRHRNLPHWRLQEVTHIRHHWQHQLSLIVHCLTVTVPMTREITPKLIEAL